MCRACDDRDEMLRRRIRAGAVDAQLAQAEEDAEVERALRHVAPDRRLVRAEIQVGRLRVEDERVRDQFARPEVRLEPALPLTAST